eukprot:snap_masked-scaffold619_size123246-processed-gene-0.21 protein:Tk05502 transcript:snap_masked-scaffold619_size123246-processed-gene-0.21-mRNA-1 annotation:"hypothetical protein BRAFLDRAFT_113776"
MASEEATPEEEVDDGPRIKPTGLGYEYLDHTADVQIHAWGPNLQAAFEQTALGMFGYMTELDTIEEQKTHEIEVSGHDLESTLYNFLDEWLFHFSAEPFFIPFKVNITEWEEDDEGQISLKALGLGETFDLAKHPQGTEVKAITYSAMQIHQSPECTETFVIIDI